MHKIADHLYEAYQQEKIDEARDGLKDMQIAFVKMTNVLDEWE